MTAITEETAVRLASAIERVADILELRRVKIDHPKWKVAMQAIGDSLAFVESCIYYRFYVRDDQGKYVQIPLDFSVV